MSRSRDSDGGEIPDSSPNSPAENTVNFSPDPSGFYLNLAEANRDNFTILDSRSPSPTFMFNISDSPVVRQPSPAPSGFDSNLADANQGILLFRTLDHYLQSLLTRKIC